MFVQESQTQPPEVFCKKGVFENFAKFTGKHMYWSLFLIKLQAFRAYRKSLVSERLGAWGLEAWTLGLWTFGLWMPERLDAWIRLGIEELLTTTRLQPKRYCNWNL